MAWHDDDDDDDIYAHVCVYKPQIGAEQHGRYKMRRWRLGQDEDLREDKGCQKFLEFKFHTFTSYFALNSLSLKNNGVIAEQQTKTNLIVELKRFYIKQLKNKMKYNKINKI